MSAGALHEPRVTVLLAEDEPALPGLDRLGGDITLREVRGDNGLAEALAETDILVVTENSVQECGGDADFLAIQFGIVLHRILTGNTR